MSGAFVPRRHSAQSLPPLHELLETAGLPALDLPPIHLMFQAPPASPFGMREQSAAHPSPAAPQQPQQFSHTAQQPRPRPARPAAHPLEREAPPPSPHYHRRPAYHGVPPLPRPHHHLHLQPSPMPMPPPQQQQQHQPPAPQHQPQPQPQPRHQPVLCAAESPDQPNTRAKHTHKLCCPHDGCTARFRYQSKLERHIRTHTGEKPFKCEVPGCTMAFVQQDGLRRHMRSHNGEKPFACPVRGCSKRFSESGNLKRHQLVHQKKMQAEPFQCDVCGRAFTTAPQLAFHETTHHNV